MSYLIDDVARTLAGPMPRRKAFRYILGTLLGSMAAPFAFATSCTSGNGNGDCCVNGTVAACGGSNFCCNPSNGSNGFCCSKSTQCCCASGTCSATATSTEKGGTCAHGC
jgi:hypothetical protein